MASISRSSKPVLSTEAIVIRAYPSGDSDLVLRLITRAEGKISALAKHARKSKKRFQGSFDFFDHGTFTIALGQTGLSLVRDYSPLSGFRALRDDISKLSAASVVCECFDFLAKDHQGDGEQLFTTINLALTAINEAKDDKEVLRATFFSIAELLRLSGFSALPTDTPPSSRHLIKLIDEVERLAERPLQSKETLLQLIQTLKPKRDSVENESH